MGYNDNTYTGRKSEALSHSPQCLRQLSPVGAF